MKTRNQKPWQDNRGRQLPAAKIKEISPTWDLKTWEAYTESLDVGTEGILMTSKKFRQVAHYQTENIFDAYAQKPSNPRLKDFIEQSLNKLTTRQAHVVDLVLFQGKSLEVAAEIMGLGKTTVYDHLQRAFSHLRTTYTVRANDLIIMRGLKNFNEDPLTLDEQILEIFKEESRRQTRNNYGFHEE